jgi:hypothetical protein
VKQALEVYEQRHQRAAAAQERREHPNRSQLPKPAEPQQVFTPETTGIVDDVASPMPAYEMMVMDRRAYRDAKAHASGH